MSTLGIYDFTRRIPVYQYSQNQELVDLEHIS